MTDLNNSISDSQTTLFENLDIEENNPLMNKTSSIDLSESQDFQLVDTSNTEDFDFQFTLQVRDNKNENVQKSNFEHDKDTEENLHQEQISSCNLNSQVSNNNGQLVENFLSHEDESINAKGEKCVKLTCSDSHVIESTRSQCSVTTPHENFEVSKSKCSKRKASTCIEHVSKYPKVTSEDKDLYANNFNEINNKMIVDSNTISDIRNSPSAKDCDNNENSNKTVNTIESILSSKIDNNDMATDLESSTLIYFEENKIDNKTKDDTKTTVNKLKQNDPEIESVLESNSTLCENGSIDKNCSLAKTNRSLEFNINSVSDNIQTIHESNIKTNCFKITSANSDMELTKDINQVKSAQNVISVKDSAVEAKESNALEKISICNENTAKSRMSIEVIYDKASTKPRPKELVEIDESGEKIVLDTSQEENNSEAPNKIGIVDNAIVNKSFTNQSNTENSLKPTKGSEEPFMDITKLNKNIENKENYVSSISHISDNSLKIGLVQSINKKPDIQISNEKLNSKFILPKNDNSMIVTISDSDNSLVDDYGKSKCLEDAALNHENINMKLIQVEKVINFNIKLKCLLSIDETTKEIGEKEIVQALCESGNATNSLHQKATDSSISTACLADVSVSDTKDTSPSSVNSNPQLYQLQPTRLSFISTVSSTSSASSAVSLATRILNKESQSSQLQSTTKCAKKSSNDLSAEDKQNWEVYEKLIKEWRNSRIIMSSIINFLNNEACTSDGANKSTDVLENSQTFHSSTPEKDVKRKIGKKSTLRTIKKPKVSRHSKNLKTAKVDVMLHNELDNDNKIKISSPMTVSNKTNVSHTADILELDDKIFGKEVFAKWSDNNYYPGRVSEVIKTKYKVDFFDGKTKLLLPDFILPIKGCLEKGFSVYAYISKDEYASSAMIIDIEQNNDKTIYTVETDEGKKVQISIHDIFLTPDQAKLLKEQIYSDSSMPLTPRQLNQITLDNIVNDKRRFKKINTQTPTKSINRSTGVIKPSISGTQNKLHAKTAERYERTSDSYLSMFEDDEKNMLGIQDEIVGTLNEQFVKGPPNKVKGKARSRKKTDSREIIETLGPIPENGSNIFEDMAFILSCVSLETLDRYQKMHQDSESNSEPGTENEEEWTKRPFVRGRLQDQIIAGGGKIYNSFEEIPPEEYSNTKHITNVPNLTKKSLLCLSVGIRSYNHQWVIRSCQQNKAIQPAEEELPTGWSLNKQAYVDTFQRPKNRPLEHTIIAIPVTESEIEFVNLWKQICQNAGASVLLLNNSVETFMEATIVLANKQCPIWVVEKANSWQIPILSTTWVVQCLIEGKLCPSDTNKEFKYSIGHA